MKRYLNPRARHYYISSKLEAGIVLSGAEVKSVKTRGIQLGGALIQVINQEIMLTNAVIAPYAYAHQPDYEPTQPRKLLLKEKEISWLITQKKKKLTIVPIACYTKRGWIKVQLGIGKLKKKKDRKRELVKKQTEKDIKKQIKGMN